MTHWTRNTGKTVSLF